MNPFFRWYLNVFCGYGIMILCVLANHWLATAILTYLVINAIIVYAAKATTPRLLEKMLKKWQMTTFVIPPVFFHFFVFDLCMDTMFLYYLWVNDFKVNAILWGVQMIAFGSFRGAILEYNAQHEKA